jgi:hypothetical protein
VCSTGLYILIVSLRNRRYEQFFNAEFIFQRGLVFLNGPRTISKSLRVQRTVDKIDTAAWCYKTLFKCVPYTIIFLDFQPWDCVCRFVLWSINTFTANVGRGRFKYSGTSNFEHNPFQETFRLSSCSTFELNFPIRNNVN